MTRKSFHRFKRKAPPGIVNERVARETTSVREEGDDNEIDVPEDFGDFFSGVKERNAADGTDGDCEAELDNKNYLEEN